MVKTVISHLVAVTALSLLVAGSRYFYGRQQKQFSSAMQKMHCQQYFCRGSYPAVQKNPRLRLLKQAVKCQTCSRSYIKFQALFSMWCNK